MTLKQLRERAQAIGMTIVRKRDGEYRVNYWDGTEEHAYYTNDPDDALDTAEHMARARWPGHYVWAQKP